MSVNKMNAISVLKYVLVAGVCILGTTALWSAMHPTMDCPTCTCKCPPGEPGTQGKSGMDCQLFDDDGKLACKYADGTTMKTKIPTKGAFAGKLNEADEEPTYSMVHIMLIGALTIALLYALYRSASVWQIQRKLDVLQSQFPNIARQLDVLEGEVRSAFAPPSRTNASSVSSSGTGAQSWATPFRVILAVLILIVPISILLLFGNRKNK